MPTPASEDISLNQDWRDIEQLYGIQAEAIVAKDVDAIKALHADGFVCIPPDSIVRSESEWEYDIVRENNEVTYHHSVYTLEKISVEGNSAIAYLVRRCAGINNKSNSPYADI